MSGCTYEKEEWNSIGASRKVSIYRGWKEGECLTLL